MPKFLRTLPERGFRRRARAVAVLFCAVCLGLAVRLFFLQVRTDGFYADRAQGQQLRDKQLAEQKDQLQRRYNDAKRQMQEYGIIKQNVDGILRTAPGKEQMQER